MQLADYYSFFGDANLINTEIAKFMASRPKISSALHSNT